MFHRHYDLFIVVHPVLQIVIVFKTPKENENNCDDSEVNLCFGFCDKRDDLNYIFGKTQTSTSQVFSCFLVGKGEMY